MQEKPGEAEKGILQGSLASCIFDLLWTCHIDV